MNYTIAPNLKAKTWTTHTHIFSMSSMLATLFRVPAQLYGNCLLSLAILFSALSTVYLKTMYREHIQLLQSAQAYYETLEEKRYQLQIKHDALISPSRLQKLSQKLDLVAPGIGQTQQLL